MAKVFPNQVQCIFLRNTSVTDDADKFPYDTSGFKDLKTSQYMFFKVPDDLKNLDIANGNCLNATIPQNVTFGVQDEVLGIHGLAPRMQGSAVMSLTFALAAAFWLVI